MDCLKQRVNCIADIVRHVEDSKPEADIAVHERRVTSAHLAAADVVAGEPQFADIPRVEVAMAFQERRGQVLISVWGGSVVPEGHRITTWISVLIFAHSFADLSKHLDVTKVAEEW
jgi:hypothetical protein